MEVERERQSYHDKIASTTGITTRDSRFLFRAGDNNGSRKASHRLYALRIFLGKALLGVAFLYRSHPKKNKQRMTADLMI